MLAEGRTLTERDIQSSMPSSNARASRVTDRVGRAASAPSLTDDLDAVERDHIIRVLAEERGNKRATAERLGLSRRTLYRRLERHQLLDPRDGAVQRAGQGDAPES